ncbi:MAG TPA: FliH/SctL family protein [Bryobacteraceae bacterium]|nr:FliH/SctL family protein [Bryobacteraceae bacterium]
MSSKVLQPDDAPAVSPVVWKLVCAAHEPASAGELPAGEDARVEQLRQQYEQKLRDAHAAGVREGETAGRNRASAELQPVIDRLGHAIQDLANLRARLRHEAEADLVQLALAIARRVLRREMAIDPDALHGLILAALEKLQGQEIARVKVHPSHAGLLKSCVQQLVSGSPVEVVADPSRPPGTVIFETARGNLDASVDAQLQEIERGLADRLRKQS